MKTLSGVLLYEYWCKSNAYYYTLVVCLPQTDVCTCVLLCATWVSACLPTCVGWFHVWLMANLLCGCPLLSLLLGLVAMAIRVGRGGEPWKGMRICVWKAHQVWLRITVPAHLYISRSTQCFRSAWEQHFTFCFILFSARGPFMLSSNKLYSRILGC